MARWFALALTPWFAGLLFWPASGQTPRPFSPSSLNDAAKPTLSLDNDPLPTGAVRRLGTNRLRTADRAGYFMFSPDDRELIVGSMTNVLFWETDSWKEIWRTDAMAFTSSPDGTHVARTTGERTLEIWNRKTKTLVHARDLGRHARNLRIFDIEFNNTGDALWVGVSREGMILYDWAKDQVRVSVKLNEVIEGSLAHSRDRKTWALAGGDVRVNIYDGITGQSIRDIPFDRDVEWYGLNHNGKILATRSRLQLRLWDVATGKTIDWLPDDARVIEPGGRVVFDTKGEFFLILSTKLSVFDIASKKIVASIPFDGPQPTALEISNDNKTLVVGYDDGAVEVRDPRTLNLRIEDPHPRGSVLSLAFSRDRSSLATFHLSRAGVRLWNLQNGKSTNTFAVDFPGTSEIDGLASRGEYPDFLSLAFLPDERHLALGLNHRFNVATGQRETIPKRTDNLARASADGSRWLITRVNDSNELVHATITSPVTGKDIVKLDLDLLPDAYVEGHSVRGAFSSDGGTVAMRRRLLKKRDPNTGESGVIDNSILVWSTQGNQATRLFSTQIEESFFAPLEVSPDGRFLAAMGGPSVDRPHQLWHLPTGFALWKIAREEPRNDPSKRTDDLETPAAASERLAFSPDGQFLAGPSGASVTVRETLSGTVLHTFFGQDGWLTDLAFSPDGQTLATGTSNSTVILWTMPRFPSVKSAAWNREVAETLWNNLRGEATIAYQAMADLHAGGDEAVALLKDRLTIESDDDRRHASAALAELSDPRFLVREKASVRLEKWGYRIKPYLSDALARSADLEQKRRLAAILDRYKNSTIDPEELRLGRSVFLLERIGTPAARVLLESLARGHVLDMTAQSARAALHRMQPRRAGG